MHNKLCYIIWVLIVFSFLSVASPIELTNTEIQTTDKPVIVKEQPIIEVLLDNSDAQSYFDTTRIYGPPSNTATFRDVAIGQYFKGQADDTVRIFTVMSANPCYVMLMNDTTKSALKPNQSGWQMHGNNGRFIDSSQVGYHGAAVGDVDHDGYTDMFYSRGYGGGGPYRLFRASWNGTSWTRETLFTFVGEINEIAVGDADNDGALDVVFPAGSAVFRVRWTGSSWEKDSIWAGDGSTCHSVAIGNVDTASTRPGNELYAVTEGQRVVQLYKSVSQWLVQQVFLLANDVDFYDVAIGDITPDNKGNEIVVCNGKNPTTEGHIFYFYGSVASGWQGWYLRFASLQWGTFGEIAVGDVYDLHLGDEIIATSGSQATSAYPIMLYRAGGSWWGRYLPNNQLSGSSTYGVAIGNVNKHRPGAGIPITNEFVITTGASRSIYEYEQHAMFNNDVKVDSVFLLPSLATVEDSIVVQMKITNLGYNTQVAIPVCYRVLNSGFGVIETCFVSLGYNTSTVYQFSKKFRQSSAGYITVRCSTGLSGEEYPADDTVSRTINIYNVMRGIYTVGADGDFNTITAALTEWKNSVIYSDVTFRLTDNLYSTNETYPLICSMPVAYRNGNWSLHIKPAGVSMPTITGSNATAIFDIRTINRLKLDSLIIANNSTSGPAVRFVYGASYNRINKCELRSNSASSGVVFFYYGDNSISSGNNGNVISNCVIAENSLYPGFGVYFNGASNPLENRDDSIIGCSIYNFNNTGVYLAANTINAVIQGCDIYSQNQQGYQTLQGITITSSTVSGTKIIGNRIRDLWSSHASPILRGIFLNGGSTTTATLIANNFISLDATRTHPTATIYGICDASSSNIKFDIYNNSIYIGGNNLTSVQYSYGFYRSYASVVNLKNNIIFNNRTQTNNAGRHSTIYCTNTGAGLVSNYNDLYVSDPGGLSGQAIGYWYPNICTTFTQWQIFSGQDSASISLNPYFISESNLHINQNSVNVDRKGVPIADIVKDIDNETRHSLHPDIGADEYQPNPPGAFSLISPDSAATWQRLYGQLIWHKSYLAEYYDVYLDTLNPPQKKVSALQSDTVYNYSHLVQTKTYFWRVIAYNDTNPTDASVMSNIWKFTTVTLPPAPTNLKLSQITAGSMRLIWKDNSTSETGFYIRRDTSSTGLFPIIDSVNVNETTYVAYSLNPNTHYYWQVSAFNFWGETDPTTKDTISLAQVCGLPLITEVSFTKMRFYLSPRDNPANTKFLVRVTDESKAIKYLKPDGSLSSDTVWATFADFGGSAGKMVVGLQCNTAYTFESKARNENKIETSYGPSALQATLPALQLPFGESFELTNFPPNGWTQQVIVSGGANWSRVTSGSNPTQTPYHGAGQARYNSYNAPNGSNARLITPPLDLSSMPQADLKFYMYHNNVAGNDSLVIEVSNDYGSTWQRVDRLNRYSPTNGWQQHILSLDAVINNIVMIAFHAYSAAGNNMYIDSIAVEPISDVMVSAITRPFANELKRVSFIPQVTVRNSSSQTETIPVKSEIWRPGTGMSEGFENAVFPPTGWIVYNNDGGSERWKRNTTNPYLGNGCVSSSTEGPALRNDDWLVSLPISLVNGNEFRFWYRTSAVANDSLQVLLATNGNTINDFTILLDAFGIRTTTYTQRVISLADYAGQTVYLAFVNKGLNQSTIYLDELTINYQAPSLVYQDNDTVIVAGGDATQEVYFRPCTLSTEGNYLFKAYTELVTDYNPFNDLMVRNFVVEPIQLQLAFPSNNSYINDTTPFLDWSDITGANSYRIQVALDSSFTSLIINQTTPNSYWQVADASYLADNTYFWRVRVETPSPSDPYSSVWKFTVDTDAPAAPVLSLPPDNEETNNVRPGFAWNKIYDASVYNLVISAEKDIVYDTIISDTSHQLVRDLTQGSYNWYVRAGDAAGNWSVVGETRSLTIDLTAPDVPILISPANNAIVNLRTPTLIWSNISDAFGYNLVIMGVKDTVVSDTFCTVSLNRGNYQWKVRARDLAGNWSDFTPNRSFYIQLEWAQMQSMMTQIGGKFVKDGGALVAVDDSLIFGFLGNKTGEFYCYKLSTNIWSAKETIPYTNKPGYPDRINKKKVGKGASLCYDGDSIIYATKGNSTLEFWAYNINQNTWTPKQFLPYEVKSLKGGTSILYHNGKVYLLAGGQKYGMNNFFAYTPLTNTWQTLAMTNFSPDYKPFKDGSCLAIANDTIYALKGSGKDNFFYAYNINTNTWFDRSPIPQIHPMLNNKKNKVKNGAAMASDGNIIYAIKGGGKQDFYSYCNNSWTPLCTIPRWDKKSVPKAGAALTYADGMVWLLKGNNTLEFWKYIPSTEKSNLKYQKSSITQDVIASSTQSNAAISDFCVLPNPLSINSTIKYNVLISGNVSIKLYNSTGRLISILLDEYKPAGSYSLDIRNLTLEISKGIYFLKYEDMTNNNEVKLIVQ